MMAHSWCGGSGGSGAHFREGWLLREACAAVPLCHGTVFREGGGGGGGLLFGAVGVGCRVGWVARWGGWVCYGKLVRCWAAACLTHLVRAAPPQATINPP